MSDLMDKMMKLYDISKGKKPLSTIIIEHYELTQILRNAGVKETLEETQDKCYQHLLGIYLRDYGG